MALEKPLESLNTCSFDLFDALLLAKLSRCRIFFFFGISCWIKYLLIIQVIPSKNYRPVHFLGIKLTHNFLPVPKKKS